MNRKPKEKMMSVPVSVLKAMRCVCNYNFEEEEDYEASGRPENHVFINIRRVERFLDEKDL